MLAKVIKLLFGESNGVVLPGLFAVGSWFVSSYFPLDDDQFIRAAAILGIVGGYALGNFLANARPAMSKAAGIVSIVAAVVLGVIAMVHYSYAMGGGQITGFWPTLGVTAELAFAFLCIGYVMQLAGITFPKEGEADGNGEDNGRDETRTEAAAAPDAHPAGNG